MEIIELGSTDEIGRYGATIVETLVRASPRAVLGLATGSSPLPIYRELIRRHRSGSAPAFSGIRTFNLDEYVGLPAGHEQSYRATIARELTDPLGLPPDHVHGPHASVDGLPDVGDRYEAALAAAGGIDLQLLGIGSDGHLGFNEPGSSLGSQTRLKTLTHQTRADNARYFGSIDAVPVHVITQGIGTILRARRLVLVATGETKAHAVAAALEGPITASCPASAVQLHPHVTVLLDAAAASRLERRDYYREVYLSKPAWQRP